MENQEVIKQALKQGISEVTVLTGKATEQHNSLPVNIEGNIDAPSRFINGRKDDFSDSKRYCLVSKTDGIITLIINEQSVVNKYTIKGKIEISKKFLVLKINKDNEGYSPEELANKLKLLRSMFVSNIEHSSICSILRNLKAKVNSDIENLNDRKGNVTANFKQTVESNMPDAIKLKIPLLEGEEAIEIEVNVLLEANGGSDIKCYLESIDAAELIEKQFESRVNEEVDKIKDWVTIIEY
ncbi:hypothetical protein [Thalassobellus suaedae]|uniref:Uncharacterized protein n=1 Tax=Thalassobellus suaedae TaxID=3074124 RepID=A0ABY9XVN4_9FLAO|nr:hypothetical protein RHP51_04740 [Flavobacteriaceae bacterium HL-DH14]